LVEFGRFSFVGDNVGVTFLGCYRAKILTANIWANICLNCHNSLINRYWSLFPLHTCPYGIGAQLVVLGIRINQQIRELLAKNKCCSDVGPTFGQHFICRPDFREMLVLNRGRHKEKFLESRYGFKYWPLLPGIGQLKNAFIR
jgi:hypothetical protein